MIGFFMNTSFYFHLQDYYSVLAYLGLWLQLMTFQFDKMKYYSGDYIITTTTLLLLLLLLRLLLLLFYHYTISNS